MDCKKKALNLFEKVLIKSFFLTKMINLFASKKHDERQKIKINKKDK
jgi:hypothetical protein